MRIHLLLPILLTTTLSLFGQEKKHIVQTNETLYQISEKYKISVKDLQETNPFLKEKNLQIEDTLTIPNALDVIANSYLESYSTTNKFIEVKVEANDTLYSLGKKYKISIEKIKSINNIINENRIVQGQILKIPSNS